MVGVVNAMVLIMDDVNELLRRAETLIAEGDKASAKKAIRAALRANMKNGQAWYLASLVADSPDQKRDALLRAMEAEPDHWLARAALAALQPDDVPAVQAAPPLPEPRVATRSLPTRDTNRRRAEKIEDTTADGVFMLEGEISSHSPNEPFTSSVADNGVITRLRKSPRSQKRRTLIIVQPTPNTTPMRVVFGLVAIALAILILVVVLAVAYRDNLSALTNIFSTSATQTTVAP
jgi:hypothetical protein